MTGLGEAGSRPLLDKQFGAKRSPQEKKALAKATKSLLEGTAALGDLTAGIDLDAGRMNEEMAGDAGPRGCVDCGGVRINVLKSQPHRCRPCGTKKRAEYNKNYKDAALQSAEVGVVVAVAEPVAVEVPSAPAVVAAAAVPQF